MYSFESPLEEIFAHHAEKYLRDDLMLDSQVEVKTLAGLFRVDFLLRTDRRIVFECDGREFHEEFRDEFRDALVLGDDQADVIFHIPGAAIYYSIEDVFYFIAQWEQTIISERGLINLDRLVSDRARALRIDPSDESVLMTSGVMHRRSRIVPAGRRAHWPYLYSWARNAGAMTFDELVQRRVEESRSMIRTAC